MCFDWVSIEDLFSSVKKKAKEQDPEGEGINLFLRCEPSSLKRRVTLDFSKVPLSDVIHYICIGTGLDYVIEPYAVIIYERGDIGTKDMQTKIYDVYPSLILSKLIQKH